MQIFKPTPLEDKPTPQEDKPTPQEDKHTLRSVFAKLTGILLAAYAAYNVFIICRDGSSLPTKGIAISVLIALLFGWLAVFAWTTEAEHYGFQMVRGAAFIIVMLLLLALKLRMTDQVIAVIDFSTPYTVVYAFSFLFTTGALLVLNHYYLFFFNAPRYRRASLILPIIAAVYFLCALGMEAILFFVYHIGLEANLLRTVVMRPVFYLGLACLSAFFLFLLPKKADSSAENGPVTGVNPVVGEDLVMIPTPKTGVNPVVGEDLITGDNVMKGKTKVRKADPIVGEDLITGENLVRSKDTVMKVDPIVGEDLVTGENIVRGKTKVMKKDLIVGEDLVTGENIVRGKTKVMKADPVMGEDLVTGENIVRSKVPIMEADPNAGDDLITGEITVEDEIRVKKVDPVVGEDLII